LFEAWKRAARRMVTKDEGPGQHIKEKKFIEKGDWKSKKNSLGKIV